MAQASLRSCLRQRREKLKDFKKDYLPEIIVSFARDHSIMATWSKANPDMVEMVVNQKVPIGALNQLFERSKKSFKFRKGLEEYLYEELSK